MGCFCYFISFQSRILSKLTALKIKKRLLLNGSHSGVYYMVNRDEILVLVKESITMLSKNNFNEKIRQTDEKKDHFSIRKLTIGAASILIGMTFIGINSHTAYAADQNDTVVNTQNSASTPSEGKTPNATIQPKNNIISTPSTSAKLQTTKANSSKPTSSTIKDTKKENDALKDQATNSTNQESNSKKIESKKQFTNVTTNKDKSFGQKQTTTQQIKNKTEQKNQPTNIEKSENLDEKQESNKINPSSLNKIVTKAVSTQNNLKYNVNDWDGNLDNTNHEYTLTSYHGADKQNIYIPNTSDFNIAGKISDTDKVYVTKDLMQSIVKDGATNITIDNQGNDDKNKVYAKGNWAGAFANSSSLKKVDLSHLETSGVTNMASAFQEDTVLENANLSNWNINKITNFDNLFSGDNWLSSINLNNWNFANNPSMEGMFNWTWRVNTLDLTGAKNINEAILNKYVESLKTSHATSLDLSKISLSPEITSLSGKFSGMSDLKTVNFTGFNASDITDMSQMFSGDNNLTDINFGNLNFKNINTNGMFDWAANNIKSVNITQARNITSEILAEYASSLRNSHIPSVNLNGISVSPNVTSIAGLLSNMPNLKNVDLSGLDITHITDMHDLFSGDTNLTNVNLSGLNFANINTSGMFNWVKNIKNVNIKNAKNITQDILNQYVQSLRNTHATSINFTEINLSPNITSLGGLLTNMPNLENADLSGLNLNQINNLAGLFTGDHNLKKVNLSGLDFANVNTSGMFNWADWNIENVDITNTKNITSDILNEYAASIKISKSPSADLSTTTLSPTITSLANLFSNMPYLESVNLTGLDTSHITNMSYMFLNTPKLVKIIGIEYLNTHNVTNMAGMFESVINETKNNQEPLPLESNGNLIELDLSNWDVSNVTNMLYMFGGQDKLIRIGNLSNWNPSKVTNMAGMFFGLQSLPDDALKNLNWDTSNVTDMSYMFAQMHKQKDLSFVNNWNTAKVTDMSYMFFEDYALEKLNLANWNTESVGLKKTEQNYSLADMFAADVALVSVGDISHWNTSNVHDTRAMFYGTTSLSQVDLSGWNTGKLEIAEGMFNNSGAKYIGLNNWDLSHIKRLNNYGFIREDGELGGVENMFKDLTNPAVISMNNISLPNATNAFKIKDFIGNNPIVVIANGVNGEPLPTLLAINNQNWKDTKGETITGRQNADILTFVRASNNQELSQEGLNFIFTNLKEMQNYFNQQTSINVVKNNLGNLVSDWNIKEDTVDGHIKVTNRISPAPSYDPYNNPNGIKAIVNGNNLASLMTSIYQLHIINPQITTETVSPTRTIIIENPDGTTSTKTQIVKFIRTVIKHTDGTIEYGAWTPAQGQWDKFEIPQIKDYDSYVGQNKVSTINAVNVSPSTSNITITVSYHQINNNNQVIPPINPNLPHPHPEKPVIPDVPSKPNTPDVPAKPVIPNKSKDNPNYPKPHKEDMPSIKPAKDTHVQPLKQKIEHMGAPKTTQINETIQSKHNNNQTNMEAVNLPKTKDKLLLTSETPQKDNVNMTKRKDNHPTLPQTGESQNKMNIIGLLLIALANLGLIDRKRRDK